MIFLRRWAVFGAVCLSLTGAPADAAPTDIVPRGEIAYDLLASLGTAGLVPGLTLADVARGDRLYTRAEMAGFAAAARGARSSFAPGRELALAALEREFAPELRALGIRSRPVSPHSGLLTGTYKARVLSDPASFSQIVRLAGLVPVGRDGQAAVSIGSYRSEWYANARRNYPAVESAWVRVEGRALDVTAGVKPLRWGPGYSGALLFGDESPSVSMLEVDKSFTLPGTLGRRIGRLHFRQFGGQFFEPDVPDAPPNARGTRRYLLGRRLETAGGGRWTLSLSEAFKSTRLPDPVFAFILPFYVYQHDWTETSRNRWFKFLVSDAQPNTFWLNYVASAGLSYRADARGTTLYGDLLLDDVEAPAGLGQDEDVPQRLGVQLGVYAPNLGGTGRYAARVEFSSLDATTYTNVSRPIAWEHDGLSLGYPRGGNARVWFARLDARLSERVRAAVDVTRRRRVDNTVPGVDTDVVGVYATYALRDNAFVGVRLDYGRSRNMEEPAKTRTRFEVNAGVGF